jgi:hypothetical protein
VLDDTEDDEESRIKTIGSRKRSSPHKLASRNWQSNKHKALEHEIEVATRAEDDHVSHSEPSVTLHKAIQEGKKRKPSSFLDEVLAGKVRKKGKKNQQISNT